MIGGLCGCDWLSVIWEVGLFVVVFLLYLGSRFVCDYLSVVFGKLVCVFYD